MLLYLQAFAKVVDTVLRDMKLEEKCSLEIAKALPISVVTRLQSTLITLGLIQLIRHFSHHTLGGLTNDMMMVMMMLRIMLDDDYDDGDEGGYAYS